MRRVAEVVRLRRCARTETYFYGARLRIVAGEERAAAERLRKEQKVIDDLRQALVKNPADANLRYEAAKWLIEHGHEREGLEWTDLILRQKPGHPPTCRFLSDYHAKKGNHGLANYYRLFNFPR